MKKQERKVILIGAGIVIAILLVVLLINAISKKGNDNTTGNTQTAEKNIEKYTTNLADGTKINNSDEFNRTKKFKNIEISNIQFTFKDGVTVLLADVKNTASTKHNAEIVKLTILDENNKVIEELEPVMPTIEAGETVQFNAMLTGADSVNAKDFKIEAK